MIQIFKRPILGAFALALLSAPIAAQTESAAATLDLILEYSLVENILGGQSEAFILAVQQAGGSTTDARLDELTRVVSEEFASNRMRQDVVSSMYEASLPVILESLSVLLTTGSIAEVTDITGNYEPPESLEEYLSTFEGNPPPEARVALIAALADAQEAAGFYLLLDEAAREGAHEVASAMTEGASPGFEPLEESVIQDQLQRGFQFAVLSFLHRYRPVEDSLVASATAEYQTEAGQWYVVNYSTALAESIRLAASRVADRLERSVGGS